MAAAIKVNGYKRKHIALVQGSLRILPVDSATGTPGQSKDGNCLQRTPLSNAFLFDGPGVRVRPTCQK